MSLFTFGEGYHNYHHTFQWDYRNGVKWFSFDPSKWIIKLLSFIGITYDLKETKEIWKNHISSIKDNLMKATINLLKIVSSSIKTRLIYCKKI